MKLLFHIYYCITYSQTVHIYRPNVIIYAMRPCFVLCVCIVCLRVHVTSLRDDHTFYVLMICLNAILVLARVYTIFDLGITLYPGLVMFITCSYLFYIVISNEQ